MFKVNHDLHIHTGLSLCSADRSFSVDDILRYAEASNYDTICITNHCWDAEIPGATPYYQVQNIEYIKRVLPFPKSDKVNILFGIETEYCGGQRLGLSKNNYDLFQMIIVPVNHFSHVGLVVEDKKEEPDKLFRLQLQRLEELLSVELPWKRVGIPHLQWFDTDEKNQDELMKLEDRYYQAFCEYAKRGAGIGLNAPIFIYSHPDAKELYNSLSPTAKKWQCGSYDKIFWLYSLAKKAGCKFYIESDSHTRERLDWPRKYLPKIIEDLALKETDRFFPEYHKL